MLGNGLNSLIPPQGNEPRGNMFPAPATPPAFVASDSGTARPAVMPSSGPASAAPAPSSFVPRTAATPAPLPAFAPSDGAVAGAPKIEPARELPPMPAEPALPAPAVHETPRVVSPAAKPAVAAPMQSVSQEKREARKESESVFRIEVAKIKPNPQQPRKTFNEEGIGDLAASIREFGILQPVVVTKTHRDTPNGADVEYTLISGERRLLAAKKLGMETIPAIVRNVDLDRERLELAIIENIQREDLSAIEVARAMARLQDEFRLTQREIASKLGKSRETVANTVRLLDLPPEIQRALERGEVTESHGRLLLGVTDPAAQQRLFKDLLTRKMTTRELKERVEAVSPRRRGRPRSEPLPPEFAALREQLTAELGAPVDIAKTDRGGTLTIKFYSDEELEGIVKRLGGEGERDEI